MRQKKANVKSEKAKDNVKREVKHVLSVVEE